MKKFFSEFKTFITRGNVLDMAVGVIVGGAFTAIVTALTGNILQPIINWILALILGASSLSEVYTFLKWVPQLGADGAPLLDEAGKQMVDLNSSIYINWGAFINAIINFILIALVLFIIVRFINRFKEGKGKLAEDIKKVHLNKAEKKELKAAGVNIRDRKAVEAYFADKKAKEEAEAAAAAEAQKKAEEEAAAIERANNPTSEDLLKQIKVLLEENLKK